ncbi:hypothetical protein [Streptomyces sp. NPDC019208]|uniref:hypothetical protein n=1 Tax=Streptomyces sp. NPDC019208 TaxID=3154683 RepID=UPI0033E77C13
MNDQLPTDVQTTISALVRTIRDADSIDTLKLTAALEGLVHAGVTLGQGRQSASSGPLGGMEIRSRQVGRRDDQDDDEPLPAGACGTIFNPPRAVRSDPRFQAPCALKRGHSGKHENRKGVSWGGPVKRVTARPATTVRSNPVTTPTPKDLKARHERLRALMAPPAAPAAPARTSRPTAAHGPAQEAQRAIELARPPQWGWMPSQRRIILRQLEQAGSTLMRHALANSPTVAAHQPRTQHLDRLLADARSILTPASQVDVRQETVKRLSDAISAMADHVAKEEQADRRFAQRLADAREALAKPAPAPAPHPWFTGASVA